MHVQEPVSEGFQGRFIALLPDLVRSLWAELGAIEGPRHHSAFAIDPEVLLVFTGMLAEDDPYLDDATLDWCVRNARLLSGVRIRNLAGDARPPETGRYLFAVKRAARGGTLTVHLERPALIALRLRALFGVCARADVLGFLLARPEWGYSAREIAAESAHHVRAVARALEALRDAGLVDAFVRGGRLCHVLERPGELRAFVGAIPETFPRWRAIFRVLGTLLDAVGHAGLVGSARSIEALAIRQRIARDLRMSGIAQPVQTVFPGSFADTLEEWALELVGALARADQSVLAFV
jgi:DNA-binding transcriptional ArsR family regulator